MSHARAGADFPGSFADFEAWFATDADCLDYLEWLRWPLGFICPRCGEAGGWKLGDGRWMCSSCSHRTSVTAGTIFHRPRMSLTVWFTACWLFATTKNGLSALALQRTMQIGSYQSAWAMLHRFRSVLSQSGRAPLAGTVEVDETFIGRHEPGLTGGRARGKKVLVGIAIEVMEPRGFGRCRMGILEDASAATLHPFVADNIALGATVITDGWSGYLGIQKLGYIHEPRSQ